jgi:hypothetical protein
MKRITMLLMGLLVSFGLHANGPGAVRKTIESSMLVTGWAMIATDGSVTALEVDEREKVPESVLRLVDTARSQWKFQPVLVDGVARKARARMSLRIVARKFDAERYELKLQGGYFGEEAMTPEERLARGGTIMPVSMKPPFFPLSAAQVGARGTVYLVLKVGADGAVEEAFAEQVNLRIVGSEHEMNKLRSLFAKNAMTAAKAWRFRFPPGYQVAADEFVRVPVDYEFQGEAKPGYGQWNTYVPGPRHRLPWEKGELDASQSPDALVAGVLYQAGRGMRLLTPLHPG